jgi:catechol 2,3-dioxygenase-like lactoylglutathione lyase family enzyme
MHAPERTSQQLITLRVTDPERARGFYQDLFGLTLDDEGEATLRSPDDGEGFALRLEAREPGDSPDLWLSVEVQSVTEVLDLYLLAIMIGAQASLPRKRAERWHTVITDPDGHHISIWTTVPREKEQAPSRRSPRWEWDRAQRPGYDAGRESRRTSQSDNQKTPGQGQSRTPGLREEAREPRSGVP